MALSKQPININFSNGLDTKTDPNQVQIGKFLNLENAVFDKIGRLTKRNGYAQLTSLPNSESRVITTFNGNLTALDDSLLALSDASDMWLDKGKIKQVQLSVLPLVRSNTNQSQADSAVSASGLVCTVYTDNIPSGLSNVPSYRYVVADVNTGQNIVFPTVIPVTSGTVTGSPRVFVLGNYFMIVFTNIIAATPHLQYVSVQLTDPSIVSANVDISAQYTPNSHLNFDGYVANNNLYLAWNGSDLGGAIRMRYIDSTLIQHATVVYAGRVATHMSVTVDTSGSTPNVWAAFYDSVSSTGYVIATDQNLNPVLAPTNIITAESVANITSVATGGSVYVYYEVVNAYSYDGAISTNFIKTRSATTGGVLSSATILVRSVGLASKAFYSDGVRYFLALYSSTYQPTYFLINYLGQVVAKLAYSNGGLAYQVGLPAVNILSDGIVKVAYLVRDLVQSVNKSQGVTNTTGVYAQTGINLASFSMSNNKTVTSEIGNNLNISGGFLWAYDGYQPVEQQFHLWPDYVEAAADPTVGSMTAQQYFYQATYEWSDNQGNLFRSAPSLPIGVLLAVSTSIKINVPTLRLTYKIRNPVKIVIYRWSTAQQSYYQVTSVLVPLLNSTTIDSVSFIDSQSDAQILGNNLIYTTGGVLENIAPPAVSSMTLFKSRLFMIDAEDPDLLWYSKQVIQATPVETSDLLTLFVSPTIGAQGSTGRNKCLWPMDDKLIISKKDALYYVVGTGPDNTGANNDFSDPIFIASTVGCENQSSIVFIPAGTMFESDKGIWLLGRDLSTNYIGAPVEAFTQGARVLSAINVPGTNQVRFTMDSGFTLMYDYFYGQWGVFKNIPAISSTLYQGLHTYINSFGQVFQESPGLYLDGSKPVLMSFKTSWINLAGLQGFERFYFMYLLGDYLTPFKLSVAISYDYSDPPSQSVMVAPDNFSPAYGGDPLYGDGSPYGGPAKPFEARVFPSKQKCESFLLEVDEVYDSTLGVQAGAGLTLSGLNLVVGAKKGYRTQSASRSFG